MKELELERKEVEIIDYGEMYWVEDFRSGIVVVNDKV